MTTTTSDDGWSYIQVLDNVQVRYRQGAGGEVELDVNSLALQIKSAIASSWQARLVSDMDRCPHGRHEGDTCYGWTGPGIYDGGCYGGVSAGFPKRATGQVVAYGISGHGDWYMPPRQERSDGEAWKRSQS